MLEFTWAFETRLLFLGKKNSMAIFHFPQCEQELFYRYWDRLHAYLAQCASCGHLHGK